MVLDLLHPLQIQPLQAIHPSEAPHRRRDGAAPSPGAAHNENPSALTAQFLNDDVAADLKSQASEQFGNKQ